MRYGFIGAGFVAKFHLSAVRQVRGIEVAGVTAVSGAPELAAMARSLRVGGTVVYRDIAEMAKRVDCIAIYAPN